MHRIEVRVRDEYDDARGNAIASYSSSVLNLEFAGIRTSTVYKFDGDFSPDQLQAIQRALTDPVTEESSNTPLPFLKCWIARVGFRPGVTDNVGNTASVFIADLLQLSAPPQVFSETIYAIRGATRDQVDLLSRALLHNPLIQRSKLFSEDEYTTHVDVEVPRTAPSPVIKPNAIPLPESSSALRELSAHRMLALSVDEMRSIRAHYLDPTTQTRRAEHGLSPDPTDVELEILAQTWSEHCKHKIFAANITCAGSGLPTHVQSLFKTYIKGTTEALADQIGWLVSVFDDNAGVVRATPDHNLVFKVETHNSPSALDPYGGAITGIVGVNRDPFGTGIGASLLTNTWGYCLGPPNYDGALPDGLLHPRRIRDGVHQGVIDGGNQSGIPYSRGFELFDERYVGKPLVFCGTVGVMPPTINGEASHKKAIFDGDFVVMVGGRIGKDGIHGATFSSEPLHQDSPSQAVQIGDPITQKKMTDMLLEARDLGYYRTLTDNGAGGLSSSVGELAQLSGGAELWLEKAPLKYSGLQPWEIALSEAQERMTLAVPARHLEDLLELADRREVEASAIGQFTATGRFILKYDEKIVGDLDLEFLHHGCPVLELEAQWDPPTFESPADPPFESMSQLLVDLASDLNYCSKESKARQYDHEVKGLSVVKPLIGIHGNVPSDATVMRIAHGSDAGVILSEGIAPELSDLDPGEMAAFVVDLAVRRIVATGGRIGQIAGLDNFCWPDPVQSDETPDGKQKLAGLVRACQRLAETCNALQLPLISGKDSMKNDSTRGGVKISIPPTLLCSTMGWIDDVRNVLDLRFSDPDLAIYVVGETGDALGCSTLYRLIARQTQRPNQKGNRLPRVDATRIRQTCLAYQDTIGSRLVKASHALGQGGLGAALVRMCIAAGMGMDIHLSRVSANITSAACCLFAETPGRFLIATNQPDTFERVLGSSTTCVRIGTSTAEPVLRVRWPGKQDIELSAPQLSTAYNEVLNGR